MQKASITSHFPNKTLLYIHFNIVIHLMLALLPFLLILYYTENNCILK